MTYGQNWTVPTYQNPNQVQPYGNQMYQYSYPYGQTNVPLPQVPAAQPTQIPTQNIPRVQGRIIKDISEVAPNEVPMDGTISYFPKEDGTMIFTKTWTANGTIKQDVYKLVEPTDSTDQTQNPYEIANGPILERLERIEKLLTKKQKFYPTQPKTEGEVK